MNSVSVAFKYSSDDKTDFHELFCLFDTGSPINLVQYSKVPLNLPDRLIDTEFKGISNDKIRCHGKIKCIVKFENRTEELETLIVPDKILPIPFLVGRSGLRKFNIGLYKITPKKVLKTPNKEEYSNE